MAKTSHPEQELRRLRQQLKAGLPPVLVLCGAGGFFRDAAVELARAAVPKDAEFRSIDGKMETDGSELIDLRGGSLFGRGAYLLVRRGEDWLAAHADRLLATLDRLASGCGLILEVQKLDRRTKLARTLAEGGALFEFRELYFEPFDRSKGPLQGELVPWVVARGRESGVALRPEAALLLIVTVGKSPAELCAEIERLGSELGGERPDPLTAEQLRGHLNCSFESTPFEFVDALLAGDRGAAQRSLEAMFARGVKSRDGSTMDQGGLFPFITSWLYQSLATAYEGRQLLDEGVPVADLAGRVGVRGFADRFLKQVRDNSEPRLRRGCLLLLDCQRRLRTTGEDPQLLLERLVSAWFDESAPALGRGYDA